MLERNFEIVIPQTANLRSKHAQERKFLSRLYKSNHVASTSEIARSLIFLVVCLFVLSLYADMNPISSFVIACCVLNFLFTFKRYLKSKKSVSSGKTGAAA